MISLTHLPSTVWWRASRADYYTVVQERRDGDSTKKVMEQEKKGGIVLHRLYLHREWIIIINNCVLVSGCHGHDYDHPVGL
jgi:hypothetical protein